MVEMNELTSTPCTFRLSGRKLLWNLTDVCFVGCAHCFRASIPRRAVEPIEEAEINAVDRCLRDLGTAKLVISGGEPLLVPNLPHVIQFFTAKPVSLSVCTSLVGASLSQIRRARDAGMKRITLGVDFFHGRRGIDAYLQRLTERMEPVMGLDLTANVCVETTNDVTNLDKLLPVLRLASRITISTLVGARGQNPWASEWDERHRLAVLAATKLRPLVRQPVSVRVPDCSGPRCPAGRLVFSFDRQRLDLASCPDLAA